MAVTFDSVAFGCAYNDPPPVMLSEPRVAVVEVFGLNGVGEIEGGKTGRFVPITCTYRGYASGNALYAALASDDNRKGGTVATLSVDGVTFTNCKFRGLIVDQREVFPDGKNGLWVARDVLLVFRQLLA